MNEVYLVLANGKTFKGKGFGAVGQATGEVVFTTGMTGYLETLTDPSYFGQIVTMTFPMIGNYGIIPGDFESRYSYIKGFIVKEWCEHPSNFRSEATLDDYLKQQNIPGLYGIDTRALTKELRSAGVMNGIITPDPSSVDMERLQAYEIGEAISKVYAYEKHQDTAREARKRAAATQEPPAQRDKDTKYEENPFADADEQHLDATREARKRAAATQEPPAKRDKDTKYEESPFADAYEQHQDTTREAPDREYKVAIWDFGAKGNILRSLAKRGCRFETFDGAATADMIIASSPDGVMLTNGPGDPSINTGIIEQINLLTQSGIPIFGICLGHQLLALARGGKTEKMKFGHRGANHPVRDHKTGRVMITSQNHGYAVSADSLPAAASMCYSNANDGSCEGIDYQDFPGFSVQFHPEAAAGPNDTNFLFDRFINLMGEK